MASERASTTRQRLQGRICWKCGNLIPGPPPLPYRERPCESCAPRTQRVYFHFQLYIDHYRVTFWQGDALVGPARRYRNPATLLELLRRAHASEAEIADVRRDMDRWGRGNLYLNLTETQFRKLKG